MTNTGDYDTARLGQRRTRGRRIRSVYKFYYFHTFPTDISMVKLKKKFLLALAPPPGPPLVHPAKPPPISRTDGFVSGQPFCVPAHVSRSEVRVVRRFPRAAIVHANGRPNNGVCDCVGASVGGFDVFTRFLAHTQSRGPPRFRGTVCDQTVRGCTHYDDDDDDDDITPPPPVVNDP